MANSKLVHIVHVSEAFGGGIQTAIAQYVRSTPAAKHTIVARTRPGHNVGDLHELSDVQIIEVGRSIPEFLAKAPSIVNGLEGQVVHLHSSVAGVLRMHPRLRGPSVVYTPHCYAFERLDQPACRRRVFRLIERICGLMPHTIAGVSSYEVRVARSISRNAEVVLLPNVVHSRQGPRVSQVDNRMATVTTVGRICPQKGPEIFAEAYRAFREAGGSGDVRWVWIGDGDPELRSFLERAGVWVTGWQSNSTVQELLSRASMYVHTARWEGAPIAPLEASAFGVPVLMQRTRTTAGLGYLTFDGAEELGAATARFFVDQQYRKEFEAFEQERGKRLAPQLQSESLTRLYGLGAPK